MGHGGAVTTGRGPDAIDPGHRRRGVAGRLVAELEARFAAMGVDQIRLLTRTEEEPARRFWRALGYGEYERVVLFSKDLAATNQAAADPADC